MERVVAELPATMTASSDAGADVSMDNTTPTNSTTQVIKGSVGEIIAGSVANEAFRTALIIDGSYAQIGARKMPGGRIDYVKLRAVLESEATCRFRECWFFDQEPIRHQSVHQGLSAQYTALKLAPPNGPQFQVNLYAMKKYKCYCKNCNSQFYQNVQKGVDNGIATKILSLAYENICDRFILFAGDGDFYDSLNLIKNVLRKDLWVIGYRHTISADLQQLASRLIWMDDLWTSVQIPLQAKSREPSDIGTERTHPNCDLSATSSAAASAPRNSRGSNDKGRSRSRPTRGRNRSRDRRIEYEHDSSHRSNGKTRHSYPRGRDRGTDESAAAPVLLPSDTATNDTRRSKTSEYPLFFYDPPRGGSTRPNLHADACQYVDSVHLDNSREPREPREPWRNYDRGQDGPPQKRKRDGDSYLPLHLSDMSSDEDDHYPPAQSTLHQQPKAKEMLIINLASESDSG